MQLPNWFKIIWWVVLLAILTIFLYQRYPDVTTGKASTLDALAFVIWIALMLVPIFQEINFFGVKLKQEIKSLKEEVKQQIGYLQNEIRTNIHTEISPQIILPSPPPDSQLPKLEERIRSVLQDVIQEQGVQLMPQPLKEPDVSEDVHYMFAVRYSIEKELRRIYLSRVGHELKPSHLFINPLVHDIMKAQHITPELAEAIRKVYSVCSPAIHAEEVSAAQIAFVKDLAPELIAALKGIG